MLRENMHKNCYQTITEKGNIYNQYETIYLLYWQQHEHQQN